MCRRQRAFCFTTFRFEGRFWFCVCFELCRPSLLLSLKDGALFLSLSIPLRSEAARESLAAPELDVELRRLSAHAAQISLWRTAKRYGWQPRSAFTQWATSG